MGATKKDQAINLIGRVFNRWAVIERAENKKGGAAYWLCRCSCDKKTLRILSSYVLRSGHSKSCGCLKRELAVQRKLIDLSGMKFGKLTVISRIDKPDHVKTKEPFWLCKCDCDGIKSVKIIQGSSLRGGLSTSCGCYHSEIVTGKNSSIWKGGKDVSAFDTYVMRLTPYEDVREHPNFPNILQTRCTYCNKWITPTRTETSRRVEFIEGKETSTGWIDEGRFYCKGSGCRKNCPIYQQQNTPKGFKKGSSREVQSELRKLRLEIDNWTCQRCGETSNLHCHHIEGLNYNPIESADIDMVVILCKSCHKLIHSRNGCTYEDFKCR